MNDINSGDILVQLIYLVFTIGVITLIISFVRFNKKRRNQLDILEKKIDTLSKKQSNNNDNNN